jgi:hypothetical protein
LVSLTLPWFFIYWPDNLVVRLVNVTSFVTLLATWSMLTPWYCLTVFEESAQGNDEMEEWPTFFLTDAFMQAVWLYLAFVISLMPGAVLGSLLKPVVGQEVFILTGPLSAFFCFPVILLANVESNSIFQPMTWTLWRSFRKFPLYWIGFYLLSLLLMVVGHVLVWIFSWHLIALGIVYGPIITTMLFLYARLLGRLAWVIDTRFHEEALEEEGFE